MRIGLVSLALVAMTACTTEDVTFQHQSSVQSQTRGVAMLSDMPAAQLGMSGNTCQVDTSSGSIGNDVDTVPLEDDQVVDALGQDTLVIGEPGVFVLEQGAWSVDNATVNASNVIDAKFTDDGIVALREPGATHTVDWYGQNGQRDGSVTLPDGDYFGTITVDSNSGTVYVPGENGVVVATPDGASSVGESANLAAWDAAANVLYTAQAGLTVVSALETDGTVRWTVDLGTPVVSLDDMTGNAAVMTGDAAAGELIVLNGDTGEIVSALDTPSAADEIMVGNNGRSMAMILRNEVHFFGVNLTAGP